MRQFSNATDDPTLYTCTCETTAIVVAFAGATIILLLIIILVVMAVKLNHKNERS